MQVEPGGPTVGEKGECIGSSADQEARCFPQWPPKARDVMGGRKHRNRR